MLDGPRRDAAEAPARQLVVLLHGYGAGRRRPRAAVLRGLPGVDGATDALAHSPKNLGPDQRAPVMTWAILESDR